MEDLNYSDIEYLRDFIPFKAFFDDLLPQYDEAFEAIGGILKRESPSFCIKLTEDIEELIDFLDGNGFEIEWAKRSSLYMRKYYVDIKPLYPPKPEPEPEPTCELVWTEWTESSYYVSTDDIELTAIRAREKNIERDWYEDEYLVTFLSQQISKLYKKTHKKTRKNGRAPPKG